jgi:hypothetical protein
LPGLAFRLPEVTLPGGTVDRGAPVPYPFPWEARLGFDVDP